MPEIDFVNWLRNFVGSNALVIRSLLSLPLNEGSDLLPSYRFIPDSDERESLRECLVHFRLRLQFQFLLSLVQVLLLLQEQQFQSLPWQHLPQNSPLPAEHSAK